MIYGTDRLSDSIIKFFKICELERDKYLLSVTQKIAKLSELKGIAFDNQDWKRSNYPNRNYICRITAHGFHHKLCHLKHFHEIGSICKCKFCGSAISDKYHIYDCCGNEEIIKFCKKIEVIN